MAAKNTSKATQQKRIEEEAMNAANDAWKRSNGDMPLSFYYDKEMTKRLGKQKKSDKNVPVF